MCWILSSAVTRCEMWCVSHEKKTFFPSWFLYWVRAQLYNWSPLWADILKANFIEFLSPPFDKFKFKILLECWEKTQLCNLFFVVLWDYGAHLLDIHCFILSFSWGEILKLENIVWNISRDNSKKMISSRPSCQWKYGKFISWHLLVISTLSTGFISNFLTRTSDFAEAH